jgi:hypothetical protein
MWFRFVGLILFVLPCAAQLTAQTTEPPLPSFPTFNIAPGAGRHY